MPLPGVCIRPRTPLAWDSKGGDTHGWIVIGVGVFGLMEIKLLRVNASHTQALP